MTYSTQLTWRESRVFRYIQLHTEEHGYAPSIAEIGVAVDLISSSSVAYVLSRLELKGYITRTPGRNRALVINGAHEDKVTVDRNDLADALKLIGPREADANGPVARLAAAAGVL